MQLQVDTAFVLGKTLLGVVTDWSDSEILKGSRMLLEKKLLENFRRDARWHWLRSCKRVAECIASSINKHMEYGIFIKNCH